MKIGYLSVLPPPGESANSGVLKVSETLIREFETIEGTEIHSVTLIDGLTSPQHEKTGSVTRHYLPCRPKGKTATFYLRETFRLRSFVRSLGVDVVHGQPTSEYLLAATGCGRPSVITIHGLVLREQAGLSRLSGVFWANWIRETLQCRALRRAQHVISISPYVDDYVSGKTKAKVWSIPNPIDPEFFDLPAPNREGLRILCVGIVSIRKNQRLLVEACGILKRLGLRFDCRIVGKQDPTEAGVIGRLIVELGLEEQVALCGIVSREELLRHYIWSNTVVLPSLEETAPLSLIQGMAAGRAVLGAAAAGIPALLSEGKWGGLFPAEKPSSLADQLAAIAMGTSDDHWRKAADSAAYASKIFRPSEVAARTVRLYREIAQGSPTSESSR